MQDGSSPSSTHCISCIRVSVALQEAQGFSSMTGKGVKGVFQGKPVAVGNATLVGELHAELGPLRDAAEHMRQWSQMKEVYLAGRSSVTPAEWLAQHRSHRAPDPAS